MKLRSSIGLVVIVITLACGALTGCDLINKPTKVANGQLYESGDGKYDPYFASVHQEQVAAARWPDESKAARKPIITALDLHTGASNALILAATREKKGDPAVGRAIDETTTAELELSRRLAAAASNLDELFKRGDELRKQAIADKKNLGADKADEQKVAKKEEVKREVSAAVDAVEAMRDDARKGGKEAEELASKLKGAWSGRPEGPSKEEKRDEKKDDTKEEKKKDDKKKPEATPPIAKKHETKKPAAKPEPAEKAEPSAPVAKKPAPEPRPAPTQKPTDEVFNP